MSDRYIWLTSIETAETVGLPVSRILLVEQKDPQNGGAVALHLDQGKEVQVIESLERIADLLGAPMGDGANGRNVDGRRIAPAPVAISAA